MVVAIDEDISETDVVVDPTSLMYATKYWRIMSNPYHTTTGTDVNVPPHTSARAG